MDKAACIPRMVNMRMEMAVTSLVVKDRDDTKFFNEFTNNASLHE